MKFPEKRKKLLNTISLLVLVVASILVILTTFVEPLRMTNSISTRTPIEFNDDKDRYERFIVWKFQYLESLEHQESVGYDPTPLGYTYLDFEEDFYRKVSGKNYPDENFRLICHDAALTAVLAMNQTDHLLRRRYNLIQLADFDAYPKLVQDTMIESTMGLDFVNLRNGHFKFNRQSGTAMENLYIGQVIEGQLRYVMELDMNPDENGTVRLDEIQTLKEIVAPIWLTKLKNPPQDLSSVFEQPFSCGLSNWLKQFFYRWKPR